MADAAVSLVLKRLAPLIEKRARSEVNLVINSKEEIQKLASKLKRIQEVLHDAEERGVTDREVKSWLNKLEDVAYEIHDAMDEWEFKNLASKIEALAEDESSKQFYEKVSSFVQSLCLCFKDVLERREILWKVKGLNEKIVSIAKENEEEYKFVPNLGRSRNPRKPNRKHDEVSRADMSKIYGRKSDKDRLLKRILVPSESAKEKNGFEIISIVGSGGMGKTTLAKLVFNDHEVKSPHFDAKIWVCVSDPFDGSKIATAILEHLDPKSPIPSRYETQLRQVGTSISGKRFLLVLDDVWTENKKDFDALRDPLMNGASGSVILVTTRKDSVLRALGKTQRHEISKLSDTDCWVIVREKAFVERNEDERERLEKVGEDISKKCGGSPLAAEILGGFLCDKDTVDQWNAILRREIWQLEIAEVELFPHFYLSYNELSPETKRCLSYCAIFPKDRVIQVDNLIRIWMAQGFLSSTETEEMEQQGRGYFQDLAKRSFFQDFEKDEFGELIISCKMHDIVHDFAQFMTKHECLVVESADGIFSTKDMNIRHLYWKNTNENFDFHCSYDRLNGLRSFLSLGRFEINLVRHLTKVRILRLTACKITEIPAEIGSLIHLRFLSLRGNPIKVLPPSLFELYNLQSLVLSVCTLIQNIPKEIGNLICLRYLDLSRCKLLKDLPETLGRLRDLQTLDISFCPSLSTLPQGISKLTKLRNIFNDNSIRRFPQELEKLTNLRNMSFLAVGENDTKPGCLKNLNQLGGSLNLWIQDVNEVSEVEKLALGNKAKLRKLGLFCRQVSEDATEALQPHRKLHFLSIEYKGPLPRWIMSLTNLRNLGISNCNNKCLPPLGKLPFLEKLVLWELNDFEQIGAEFMGITKQDLASKKATLSTQVAFPKLKSLSFRRCKKWRVWEDIKDEEENTFGSVVIMPCLEELQIMYCNALKELPSLLLRMTSSLKELRTNSAQLVDCFKLKTGRHDMRVRVVPY